MAPHPALGVAQERARRRRRSSRSTRRRGIGDRDLTLSPALRRNLVAGALAGLCGALSFALAHAIVIVPIWSRSAFGLVSGALAGTVAGWTYTELGFEPSRVNREPRVSAHAGAGAQFGALLWLAVAPVTLADALLRSLGVVPRYELVAVGVAVVLAIGAGALLGWRRMRSRRAAIAGASATLLLTVAMAGPVPIGRSLRALTIFLAVFPAAVAAGAVLGALSWSLRRVRAFATPTQDAVTPS
ncbi:MAG: hypothetical protein ABR499_01615 [Gemmatimonadaceae bacterium]